MANNDSETLQMDVISIEDNIIPEVQGEVPLEMLETDTDKDCFPVTPEQKIGSQVVKDDILDAFIGSESSSDLSTLEGSETMLAVKNYLLQHDNGDEILRPKIVEAEGNDDDEKENICLDNEVDKEGLLVQGMKSVQFEALLEKVASYEVELKLAKKKIESNQDEIARLKYENLTLAEELDRTIKKLHTSEDYVTKMEEEFRKELHNTQHQLQEMLEKATNDSRAYGSEIDELKLALHDAHQDFSREMLQKKSEITHLRDQRDALDARLEEAERKNRFLEEQIHQHEVAKAEIRSSHEARERGLLDEIMKLNSDLSQSLDANKLKYDLLMAEKEELFAKLQTLHAEMNHQHIHIQQMEEEIGRLSAENEELIDESRKSQKLAEELKMKVVDQEKDLEKQRAVIHDRAEEKREAIRQLCFSLEHYRKGYDELRQAFTRHKHPAVLAL